MKKYLLIGISQLFILTALSQNGKLPKPSGVIQIASKKLHFKENTSATLNGPIKNTDPSFNSNSKTTSINLFTGSMDVFGYLLSSSKPLQYNPGVNAVSFVARKSPTYTPSANGNSGSIVGLYTTNMGTTWNETCLWANATNLARYPNGGIYNPLGNTNINNAYLVAAGPITNSTGWTGNWYASKQITTPGNNVAGADQQAMLNASLPAGIRKHHFSHSSFTTLDGGLVRSVATLLNDPDATTPTTIGLRGFALVKGLFSAGAFVWSMDSFIPPTTKTTIGNKNLSSVALQAWSETGSIGYLVMIGSRVSETLTATSVNTKGGMQPIVYKTTTSGASWSLLPANDFSDNWGFRSVYERTYPISTNSLITVANFSGSEGWDVTIDANNQLHLASMVYGHSSNHIDSLDYRYAYGTEQYSYAETGPFQYPVIYDFYTVPTWPQWKYHMVDSMGTEGPSGILGQPGYATNVWSDGSGGKMDQNARIQMSRSVDGTKIFYSWTESDSTLLSNKWNTKPELKMRGYDITIKKVTPRIDLTNGDINHTQKAYYHYMCNKAPVSAGCYTIPTTITRNTTLDGSFNVDTYFNTNGVICASSFSLVAGIKNELENSMDYEVSNFPNPADKATTIVVGLKEASGFEVAIYNSIGQLMDTYKLNGQTGDNEINVDLSHFSSGVYFYTIKVGGSVVTKKLVVQ